MADNKIIVELRDVSNNISSNSGSTSNESFTASTASAKVAPSSGNQGVNQSRSKGLGIAAMVGTQSLNYITSNVNKYTGSQHGQNIVNGVQQVASLGALALFNPYVAIATVGINVATTLLNESNKKYWENENLTNSRAKAGYTSSGDVISGRKH